MRETWWINEKEKRIYRHDDFIAHAEDYHVLEAAEIPDYYALLLR